MGGVSIGPLAYSAERAEVIAGLVVFLIVSGLLARKYGQGLNLWATVAIVVSAIAARLGFVLTHVDAYLSEPLSILYFWQGGFSPLWGAIGFVLVSLWFCAKDRRLAIPAVASVLFAAGAWNMVHHLVRGSQLSVPTGVQLTDLTGQPVLPADWQGRPVVLNLWASWCPPCRREMPMMAEVAANSADVDLHFINQGEGPDTIRTYLAREGLVMRPITDLGMQMMRHFEAQGLPATLFIDAKGQLRAAHMGEISRAQLLAGIEDLKRNP